MARYEEFLKQGGSGVCYLCKAKPVKEYKYWKIVENEFPYDEVADINHIVTIKKHKKEEAYTKAEIQEYKKVKEYLHKTYNTIMENTNGMKSIPEHQHFHLLRIKEREMRIENPVIGLVADFLKQKIQTTK